MWEPIRTQLIIVGIVVLLVFVIFLYLLIAGADESRRHDRLNKREANVMADNSRGKASAKSVFIIGAKCIGQYGGYETFLDRLTEVHASDSSIQYYIVTKANGDGAMDEGKPSGVSSIMNDDKGHVRSFCYHNANVVKLDVPQIGAAQAIAYDVKAFRWCLKYIDFHHIENPIIYVLACRIGPFFGGLVNKAHRLGAKIYVNPDGDAQIISRKNVEQMAV